MSSWADRLRPATSTATTVGATFDEDPVVHILHNGDDAFEAMQRASSSPLLVGSTARSKTSTLAALDVGVWVHILSCVGYRDVCAVGSTCRGLWSLHLVDWVWYWQECYLRRDMWSARGYPAAAATVEDEVPQVQQQRAANSGGSNNKPLPARYHRFKTLKVLIAKDFRREWDFRELASRQHEDSRQRGFFAANPDMQREGVMTRPLTSDGSGRILKSELRIFDVGRPTGYESLRPRQLLSACDDLAANIDGRLKITETTEVQEDQGLLISLMVGLSARQAGDNMLHTLGPRIRLIEISRDEAMQFEQLELAGRHSAFSNLLEDFVIDPAGTRYFLGPELCNGQRVGMVVVDALRLLVVTAYDH